MRMEDLPKDPHKPYEDIIWKMIYPEHLTPFVQNAE